jgi:hypothetical protein
VLVCFKDNTAKVAGKLSDGGAPVVNNNLVYLKESGEYTVVRLLDQTVPSVQIPMTHKGLPVSKIEQYAFYKCENLQSVVIGENVTSIGANAFALCKALTSVTFANTTGWSIENSYIGTIKLENLSDVSVGAEYLRSYYASWTWTRSDT